MKLMIKKLLDTLFYNPLYMVTQWLNWKYGKNGPGPVWYSDRMPWMKVLEAQWETVLAEFVSYRKTLTKLPDLEDLRTSNNQSDFGGGNWGFLYLMINNRKNEKLRQHFPKTFSLMEDNVPELFALRFSMLGGDRNEITPHRDGHSQSLIAHLALSVPEGECSITIDNKRQPWNEGKCFAFDASALHSVNKESEAERLVLLIDTFRPVPFWLHGPSRFVFRHMTRNAPVDQIFKLHDQAIKNAETN
jgi:aspartyl/asparaginyl beta-hydroxylase (cupin superfamily)